MVEAAAGRRSGANRRRPSGGGERRRQQQQHQRLVAVAVAARVVMVAPAATPAPAAGGGGGCVEDILGCLLGVLRALGVTWAAAAAAARPQRQQPRLAAQTPRGPAPGADGRRAAAELRGIPGRIAGNGACAVASLYTLQGKKGVNQDAMIVWEVKKSPSLLAFLSLPFFFANPFTIRFLAILLTCNSYYAPVTIA